MKRGRNICQTLRQEDKNSYAIPYHIVSCCVTLYIFLDDTNEFVKYFNVFSGATARVHCDTLIKRLADTKRIKIKDYHKLLYFLVENILSCLLSMLTFH